jgi:hypothetical protein
MWNFSRYPGKKCLNLKDNPHFYEKLPMSAEKYKGQFQTYPVETFWHKQIIVLIDRPRLAGCVFIETSKVKRAFGNAWVPKEAIIFKGSYFSVLLYLPPNILLDVCGKLEGENIIGSAIENTPNVWCFEEPSLSNSPWPSLVHDRSSPSQTTTATPVTSPTGALLKDWREPILRMLRSQDVKINIRISDKLPTGFSSGYSEPSLPSPLPDSSSIIGSLSPTPQSQPPLLEIQIPGAFQGPLSDHSPSSYKTEQSTPDIQRPQAVELFPESPAPLSPEPLILPTPASKAAPHGPAVPDSTAP